MSYSFMVKAATVAALMSAAAVKFDEVVAAQPVHEADRKQAQDAVEAFVTALGDAPEGKQLQVNVSGSTYSVDGALAGVGFSVNGSFVAADPVTDEGAASAAEAVT